MAKTRLERVFDWTSGWPFTFLVGIPTGLLMLVGDWTHRQWLVWLGVGIVVAYLAYLVLIVVAMVVQSAIMVRRAEAKARAFAQARKDGLRSDQVADWLRDWPRS